MKLRARRKFTYQKLLVMAELKFAGMAAKRQRDRKVIAVEEMLQGRTLTLDERRRVLLSQYAEWNKEKAAWLAARGPLAWEERNAALREFWAVKDEESERLAEEVKKFREGHERLQRMTDPEPTYPKKELDAARKKLLAKIVGMSDFSG